MSLSVLRYPHNVTYHSGCPHNSQIFAINIIKHDPYHMPDPEQNAFKVCTEKTQQMWYNIDFFGPIARRIITYKLPNVMLHYVRSESMKENTVMKWYWGSPIILNMRMMEHEHYVFNTMEEWRPGLSTALTLGTWSSILTSSYGNILVVYVQCVWGLGQLLPHCFIYSYSIVYK